MNDDDYRFLEESVDDEAPPIWAELGSENTQHMSSEEKEQLSSDESSLLFQSLSQSRTFLPEYNTDLVQTFEGSAMTMYSLDKYIKSQYPQFGDVPFENNMPALSTAQVWTHCAKCNLEGSDKGNRVYPSIVTKSGDPIPSSPVSILLLGEAPGKEEAEFGFGYVGMSGRLLMVYFTQLWGDAQPPIMLGNAVLCRPRDNETPTQSQFKRCGSGLWPYLLMDRNLIADNCLIIATGAIPYKLLYLMADGTPSASNITAAHGQLVELTFRSPVDPNDTRTFTILPMYHPAYILRGSVAERYQMFETDFRVALTAWDALQTTGSIESADLPNQGSRNTIDLDEDLSGDLFTAPLSDDEADIISEIIKSDYVDFPESEKIVSYDVETTSLATNDTNNVITLAGIGTLNYRTFQFEADAIPTIGKVFKRLKENGFKIVGHNIWFDLVMSWKAGIFQTVDELPDLRDTRVMHKLVDENSSDNKLKFLCQKYFGIKDWSQELNTLMDNDGKVNWAKADDEARTSLRKYHRGDLYWTTRLCYLLIDKLKDPDVSGHWVIDYVEFKHILYKELLQTSLNGFKIDPDVFAVQKQEYQAKQDEILAWFGNMPYYQRVVSSFKELDKDLKNAVQQTLCNFRVGDSFNPKTDMFNPNSTQHVSALLATVLADDDMMRKSIIKSLGRKAKTAKGKISLNEANIEKICETLVASKDLFGHTNPHRYAHVVEGLKKILEFRATKKIISTYLEGYTGYLWPDGSVRPQWNVDGAATGRLSCIAEGTSISLADGSTKPIEEITKEDVLYCFDKDNTLQSRPVIELIPQGKKTCIRLQWRRTEDGVATTGELICTPDHKLRVVSSKSPNGYTWIKAKDCLRKLVYTANASYAEIYSIRIDTRRYRQVYDIHVHEIHNFMANGLCCHNCARPNVQQIPRGDTAKGIKSFFVPRNPDEQVLMQFDLSQAELRGLGSFTHDPNLKHAYDEGLDLHTYTASNIFHVPMDKVEKRQRQISKTVNFATVYGANAPTIAANAGLPLAEAEEVLKKWFEFYSGVKPFMEARSKEVETQGYVTGLWGLKRNLPMSMAFESDGADLKRQAGNCVDVETEILTSGGWKRYFEITVGDSILSLNMETLNLERDVIKAVNVFKDGSYDCIEFKHPSVSAVTTLNHRWPVYTPRDDNAYHFTTTRDMSINGYDRLLRCASGLVDANNAPFVLTEDLCRVIGLSITDGSMLSTKDVIYHSITANPEKVARIENLLKQSGLSFNRTVRTRKVHGVDYQLADFYLYKCLFTDWLRNQMTTDYALRPEFVFTLSMQQARYILDEVVLADGMIAKSQKVVCCENVAKADSLQMLAMVAGYATSVRCYTEAMGRRAVDRVGNKSGYVDTKQPYYKVSILRRDKVHIYQHHRSSVTVDMVWCPTTGNGTWIARRRGKVFITGNSSIQNFASDFNCFLMLLVADKIKADNLRNEIRMVNTVHDSIVYEVKRGYESTLARFYTEAMQAMNTWCAQLIGKEYYINMRGDCEMGSSYGNLHGVDINPDTYEVTLSKED